jgi:formamidase
LRTAPPREIGGNIDIKQLRAGSVLTLPVDVPGALFSAGDCHFAQGDGEATGTAIEITATVKLRFGVVKEADAPWRPRYPSFEYTEGAVRNRREARRWIGTTGLPLETDGSNAFLDLNVCAREALREMIDYLTAARGLTREQAYILVSVAGDLRVSEGVDVPNPIVSVHLPLDVFEA